MAARTTLPIFLIIIGLIFCMSYIRFDARYEPYDDGVTTTGKLVSMYHQHRGRHFHVEYLDEEDTPQLAFIGRLKSGARVGQQLTISYRPGFYDEARAIELRDTPAKRRNMLLAFGGTSLVGIVMLLWQLFTSHSPQEPTRNKRDSKFSSRHKRIEKSEDNSENASPVTKWHRAIIFLMMPLGAGLFYLVQWVDGYSYTTKAVVTEVARHSTTQGDQVQFRDKNGKTRVAEIINVKPADNLSPGNVIWIVVRPGAPDSVRIERPEIFAFWYPIVTIGVILFSIVVGRRMARKRRSSTHAV